MLVASISFTIVTLATLPPRTSSGRRVPRRHLPTGQAWPNGPCTAASSRRRVVQRRTACHEKCYSKATGTCEGEFELGNVIDCLDKSLIKNGEAASVPVAGQWIAKAKQLLERFAATQNSALDQAAKICAESIANDGLVYLFGTGHSRMAVEEMFPRYASYPGFHPLVELSTTFHTQVIGSNGQRQAMFIERVEGLGEIILRNFFFHSKDAFIVVSASGVTANSIEIAMGARKRGLPVIALTSVAQSMASAPLHSSGTRLLDHADIVIDLCTPPGDALVPIDGLPWPIGPASTVTGIAAINEIKVRTAELLAARGAMPPVLVGVPLVDPEASARLFDAAYDEHARRLAGRLHPSRHPPGEPYALQNAADM